jgi:sucrose-6-phosphate hydrolase SacC (GH32 family)
MTTEQKYDVRAILPAHQKEPHFLACSRDGKLIMRRDENRNFMLLAHDQETIVEMSAIDARDFALWVLMANV